MSFAGWNLLASVLRQIPPVPFKYRTCTGVTENDFGQSVATYGSWTDACGQVQPASESNEHTEGTDFSKKTVNVWIQGVKLKGTLNTAAPDQILYQGDTYNVIAVEDWYAYDNYTKCTCQEVLNNP